MAKTPIIRRRTTMKTNPERYINDALPNNKRRNTTNKKWFLPPKGKS